MYYDLDSLIIFYLEVIQVKKFLGIIMAVAVLASLTLLPAYAAAWDKEVNATVLDEDFDAYEVSDELFSEEQNPEGKPEGFKGLVYGGMADHDQGGQIVAGQVGGTNSLRLIREGFSGTATANIRFGGLSTDYGDADEIAVSFAFRFEKLGTYGFTMILGSATTDPASWGDGNTNIFAVRNNPADGTDSPSILARNGGASGDTLQVVKTGLEANTDYVLTAVFKLGTNEYTIVLNNEIVGTYTYHETMNGITAVRIDDHGYNEVTDETEEKIQAQDIVYFDDIKVGTVSGEGSGSEEGNDPAPTDPQPNQPTGDNSVISFAIAAVLMGGTAFVALRKKAY